MKRVNSGKDGGRTALIYGLVGGGFAMPLVVGHVWVRGDGMIPLTMVFVGGLVAGYLAARDSAASSRAGFVAGCIGALPGVLLFLPALADTITVWITTNAYVLTLIITPLVFASIFALAGLLGMLGGLAGEWLAGKIRPTKTATAANN